MGDTERGSYPSHYAFGASLGLAPNVAQGNIAARSNLQYGILGSLQDAAAALVSGSMTVVPVPVEIGDEFTTVTVEVGATAASTPTHAWAQLYSGALTTAVSLATQSVDGGTTVIAASGKLQFTLGAKYIVGLADAPFGYILVGIGATASTVPSLMSGSVPTAVQFKWFPNVPLLGSTIAAAGAAAPASITLSGLSALATPPIVFLT